MKKLQYIYAMEYCSAIKRNTFESILVRWMNLEPVTLTYKVKSEREKYHIVMLYMESRKMVLMNLFAVEE